MPDEKSATNADSIGKASAKSVRKVSASSRGGPQRRIHKINVDKFNKKNTAELCAAILEKSQHDTDSVTRRSLPRAAAQPPTTSEAASSEPTKLVAAGKQKQPAAVPRIIVTSPVEPPASNVPNSPPVTQAFKERMAHAKFKLREKILMKPVASARQGNAAATILLKPVPNFQRAGTVSSMSASTKAKLPTLANTLHARQRPQQLQLPYAEAIPKACIKTQSNRLSAPPPVRPQRLALVSTATSEPSASALAVEAAHLASSSPASSLIVLENRVLTQDEKINISDLRLQQAKTEPTKLDTQFPLPKPIKVECQTERPHHNRSSGAEQPATTTAACDRTPESNAPPAATLQMKKIIRAPDRLRRLTQEEISALSRRIQTNAPTPTQSANKTPVIKTLDIAPNGSDKPLVIRSITNGNCQAFPIKYVTSHSPTTALAWPTSGVDIGKIITMPPAAARTTVPSNPDIFVLRMKTVDDQEMTPLVVQTPMPAATAAGGEPETAPPVDAPPVKPLTAAVETIETTDEQVRKSEHNNNNDDERKPHSTLQSEYSSGNQILAASATHPDAKGASKMNAAPQKRMSRYSRSKVNLVQNKRRAATAPMPPVMPAATPAAATAEAKRSQTEEVRAAGTVAVTVMAVPGSAADSGRTAVKSEGEPDEKEKASGALPHSCSNISPTANLSSSDSQAKHGDINANLSPQSATVTQLAAAMTAKQSTVNDPDPQEGKPSSPSARDNAPTPLDTSQEAKTGAQQNRRGGESGGESDVAAALKNDMRDASVAAKGDDDDADAESEGFIGFDSGMLSPVAHSRQRDSDLAALLDATQHVRTADCAGGDDGGDDGDDGEREAMHRAATVTAPPTASGRARDANRNIPLKKRWEASAQQQEQQRNTDLADCSTPPDENAEAKSDGDDYVEKKEKTCHKRTRHTMAKRNAESVAPQFVVIAAKKIKLTPPSSRRCRVDLRKQLHVTDTCRTADDSSAMDSDNNDTKSEQLPEEAPASRATESKRRRRSAAQPLIQQPASAVGCAEIKMDEAPKSPKSPVPETPVVKLDKVPKSPKSPAPETPKKSRTSAKTLQPFNGRLLLVRHRYQLNSDVPLTEPVADGAATKGALQCGLCLAKMAPAQWQKHLAEHYGVGWVVGKPQIDVNVRNYVLQAMVSYFKSAKPPGVKCRMCEGVFRSALGALGHIEQCGAPAERVSCEHCLHIYAKSTLKAHQRNCRKQLAAAADEQAQSPEPATARAAVEFSNSGRRKRASLLKAETKLKAIGRELIQSTPSERELKKHISYVAPWKISSAQRDEWSAHWAAGRSVACPHSNCAYESRDAAAMGQHLNDCTLAPIPGYHCSSCPAASKTAIFASEIEALRHIEQVHSSARGSDFDGDEDVSDCAPAESASGDSDDDEDIGSGDDEEGDTPNDNNKARKSKQRKTAKTTTTAYSSAKVFPERCKNIQTLVGCKWNEFCARNHSKEPLYKHCSPAYRILAADDVDKCLPRQSLSMKFAVSANKVPAKLASEQVEWSQLRRFASTQTANREHLIYLGGPCKRLAWVPLPSDVKAQYLLVAYRKDLEKYTRFLNPTLHATLLLLYAIERNGEGGVAPTSQLLYAVRIPDGAVHCLEFLPSGGYDLAANRLALLAVGTAASGISIYALPLHVDDASSSASACDIERLTVIEVRPAFVLSMDAVARNADATHTLTHTQCLQLCWSQVDRHKLIFAGFSNGCVAWWDTTAEKDANLNLVVVNGVRHFMPLNYFYGGEKTINTLNVHYDTTGPRWLGISYASRKIDVYDVRNMMQPLLLREEACRNIVRSLDWPIMWESLLVGLCDSVASVGRTINSFTPTGSSIMWSRVDKLASPISQVHYNVQQGICVCAGDNGEVAFLNTRELYFEYVLPRDSPNRAMRVCLAVKPLAADSGDAAPLPKAVESGDDNTGDWQMFEADYMQKYGLVFGPLVKLSNPGSANPPMKLTRYMRVSCLRWNLNAQRANQLLAVGYDNGFLRIMQFNRAQQFD